MLYFMKENDRIGFGLTADLGLLMLYFIKAEDMPLYVLDTFMYILKAL